MWIFFFATLKLSRWKVNCNVKSELIQWTLYFVILKSTVLSCTLNGSFTFHDFVCMRWPFKNSRFADIALSDVDIFLYNCSFNYYYFLGIFFDYWEIGRCREAKTNFPDSNCAYKIGNSVLFLEVRSSFFERYLPAAQVWITF